MTLTEIFKALKRLKRALTGLRSLYFTRAKAGAQAAASADADQVTGTQAEAQVAVQRSRCSRYPCLGVTVA